MDVLVERSRETMDLAENKKGWISLNLKYKVVEPKCVYSTKIYLL